MKLNEAIRYYRLKNNIKQKELADRLHFTSQAVSRWELGDVKPNVDTLKALAKIFNISLDQLINGETPEDFTETSTKESDEEEKVVENNVDEDEEDKPEIINPSVLLYEKCLEEIRKGIAFMSSPKGYLNNKKWVLDNLEDAERRLVNLNLKKDAEMCERFKLLNWLLKLQEKIPDKKAFNSDYLTNALKIINDAEKFIQQDSSLLMDTNQFESICFRLLKLKDPLAERYQALINIIDNNTIVEKFAKPFTIADGVKTSNIDRVIGLHSYAESYLYQKSTDASELRTIIINKLQKYLIDHSHDLTEEGVRDIFFDLVAKNLVEVEYKTVYYPVALNSFKITPGHYSYTYSKKVYSGSYEGTHVSKGTFDFFSGDTSGDEIFFLNSNHFGLKISRLTDDLVKVDSKISLSETADVESDLVPPKRKEFDHSDKYKAEDWIAREIGAERYNVSVTEISRAVKYNKVETIVFYPFHFFLVKFGNYIVRGLIVNDCGDWTINQFVETKDDQFVSLLKEETAKSKKYKSKKGSALTKVAAFFQVLDLVSLFLVYVFSGRNFNESAMYSVPALILSVFLSTRRNRALKILAILIALLLFLFNLYIAFTPSEIAVMQP